MTVPRASRPVPAAFVALAAMALAILPASAQVGYVVQPVRTDSLIHLRVEMEFRGEADGATRVSLPRDRFGVSEMHRWVRGLTVEGSAELHPIEPGLYEVRGEPGSEIRISYEVVYDPEAGGFIAFGPSVGPEHFHFFGSQWMARLQPHEGPRDIEVRLRRGDDAEALGSSYGIGPGPHRVRADDYDLDYSVIAGGRYRTARARCRRRPVHTMIHGDFEVPDSTIFSLVPKIVCGQRELFEDFDRPFFTVFVTGRDHLVAGAPVLHGFTAFLESEADEAELRHLLAHEMIHTWFPRTARLVEPERPDAPEARTRWFHEGFTEYLSRIALVSQGLESRAWRVERTNEDLERLAYLPYATATLDELEEAVGKDRYSNSHHRLHYRRGALLALNWDRRIRHRSAGARTLLDPLREALGEARASGGTIDLDRFGAILAGYGVDALADVRRHLESRGPLAVEQEAYGPDYALGSRRLPSFDPGFDVAATLRTRAVTGLRADGPAARAGLEEGMEVVDLENATPWLGTDIPPPRIGRWNPGEPTVVVVEADGQRRRFSFSARGPDRDIPTFLHSSSGQPTRALAAALLSAALGAACSDARRAPGLGEASELDADPVGTDTPLVSAAPVPVEDVAEFIGVVHPPAPPEAYMLAGSLVRTSLEGPVQSDHMVHHVRAGQHWMLWLSRRERWIRVETARVPVWRVVDAERIPPRMPGRRLMTLGCRAGDDPAVVALVEREPVPELRNVHHAWRLDVARQRIDPIPAADVWCENPGAAFRR